MSEPETPQSGESREQAATPAAPPPPEAASSPAEPRYAIPAYQPPVASASSAAAPPQKKSRVPSFLLGAFSGCLFVFAAFIALIVMIVAAANDDGELNLSPNKVAIVPIEGEIVDARETLDLLHKYAKNDTVKAIVVRINSPGGAIAPSQEIYSAIRRVRKETGKPVVASLDSVAASGGFYIAVACDPIVANPGSITGSIGVILQWFDVKDLLQWAKVKPETITSGALKDAGSPYRQMTENERAYFQSVVSQLHSQFVRDVAAGRGEKMKLEEVQRIADGRIFTGEQALSLKLIDELGTIDDAVTKAAAMAGIEGEPAKVWPRRREPGLFDLLTESGDAESIIERVAARRIPRFLYRW
ncbi:MAG TPA: signal peptide peptidase SppA [Thermoanaerobaculia bacterium]|nr:signal peptide peptidase SppA [Thermoanaerobaculia bacterium]